MTAMATPTRFQAPAHADQRQLTARNTAAPIVAAVDGSAASRAAVETALRLAAEMDAHVVFVYVRRGPARFLGEPVYQLRLTAAMARARRVLVAVALNGVPMDVLAERLETTRGSLYKTLHDARRKLRSHLGERGLSVA